MGIGSAQALKRFLENLRVQPGRLLKFLARHRPVNVRQKAIAKRYEDQVLFPAARMSDHGVLTLERASEGGARTPRALFGQEGEGPPRVLRVLADRAPYQNPNNQRGTAEQWIKEGKEAPHWTRLSCHRFRANEVRLLLAVIAQNLGNLLRRLVLPISIQSWSLTNLQQRLFKTGGRLIRHARYFTLQLAGRTQQGEESP